MACGCANKGSASGARMSESGLVTYRVMVAGRQVYESSSKEASDAVASRFTNAEILPPSGALPVKDDPIVPDPGKHA